MQMFAGALSREICAKPYTFTVYRLIGVIAVALQPHFYGIVILLSNSLRTWLITGTRLLLRLARFLAAHTNIKCELCVECVALKRRSFTPSPQASDMPTQLSGALA